MYWNLLDVHQYTFDAARRSYDHYEGLNSVIMIKLEWCAAAFLRNTYTFDALINMKQG